MQIAPSGYWQYAAKRRQPELRCARAKQDETIKVEIMRVYETNFCVYGVVKVWKQLHREGILVVRCTIARLMKQIHIQGG